MVKEIWPGVSRLVAVENELKLYYFEGQKASRITWVTGQSKLNDRIQDQYHRTFQTKLS